MVWIPPPLPTKKMAPKKKKKLRQDAGDTTLPNAAPTGTAEPLEGLDSNGALGEAGTPERGGVKAFFASAAGIGASMAGIVFALSIRIFIGLALLIAEAGVSVPQINMWLGLEIGTIVCLVLGLVLTTVKVSWLLEPRRQLGAYAAAFVFYSLCTGLQTKLTYDYAKASWGPSAPGNADKFFPVFFLGSAVCCLVAALATAYGLGVMIRAPAQTRTFRYSAINGDPDNRQDVPLLGAEEESSSEGEP